jgi:crotonobetainyl-CoA:carnitine CoA-transferase CaiB-like acyl-CoA transferase
MVSEVEDGAGGMRLGLGLPINLNDNVKPYAVSAAPRVGQHTRDILQQFEFTADEIESLLACGAVYQSS